MKIHMIIFFALSSLLLSSCFESTKVTPAIPSIDQSRSKTISTTNSEYTYDNDLIQNPYKNEKTDTARKLLVSLLKQPKNEVFSPLSLEAVLTLLMQGASGKSYSALSEFLQLKDINPLDHLVELKDAVNFVGRPLGNWDDSEPTKMKLNFGIASSKKYPLDKKAIEKVQSQIDLFLKSFDFENEADQALDEINSWVENQTEDKVKKLLNEIHPATVMILINTLYLKSSWEDPFKEQNTRAGDFKLESGVTKKVDMMNKQEYFQYVDQELFQAISVPIKTPDIQFWFLRPKKDLYELKDHISKTRLKTLFEKVYSQKVELHLPKFKIKNKLKLMDALVNNGLKVLTQSPNTELDGFLVEKGDFIVTEAVQGNFFAIDEKGVEAASATALGMRAGGVPQPDEPVTLKFDRPFLFLMYQRSTGRILFEGQVYDPEMT